MYQVGICDFNNSMDRIGIILYKKLICVASTGISNLEYAVRPPGNSNEAIPLEAIVQTIPPLERIANDKVA